MTKRQTYERKGWLQGVILAMLLVCSVVTGILVTEPLTVSAAITTTKVLSPSTSPGTTLSNNTIYKVTENVAIEQTRAGYSGLYIPSGATVVLDIAEGCTLTVKGGDGSGRTGGGAGIYVPSNSSLIILGKGTLKATGGNGGDATNGGKGGDAACDWYNYYGFPQTGNYFSSVRSNSYGNIGYFYIRSGWGGNGGNGGGGAGAGIGGNGGTGGAGGSGGGYQYIDFQGDRDNKDALKGSSRLQGRDAVCGAQGGTGGTGGACGYIYISERVTIDAKGGTCGNDALTSRVQPKGNTADDSAWRKYWRTDMGESGYFMNFYIFAGGGGSGGGGDTVNTNAPGIGGGIGGGAGGNGGGSGGVLCVALARMRSYSSSKNYDVTACYNSLYKENTDMYSEVYSDEYSWEDSDLYLNGCMGYEAASAPGGTRGKGSTRRLIGYSYERKYYSNVYTNWSGNGSNGSAGYLYMIPQTAVDDTAHPSVTMDTNRTINYPAWNGKHSALGYTLTFDNAGNGDEVTGGVSPQTVYYEAPVTDADNISFNGSTIAIPKRQGYKFESFSDLSDPDNPVVYYTLSEDNSKLVRNPESVYHTYGNKTLTAVWKSTIRTVQLDANGGTNGGTTKIKDGDSISTIQFSAPSRTGYSFAGYYYTHKDNNLTGKAGQEEMWYGPTYSEDENGEYMKDASGDYVPYVEPEEGSPAVTRYKRTDAWIDYQFNSEQLKLSDGEQVVLRAKWIPKKYNIDLYSDGGYVKTLSNVAYGQLKLPSADELGISKSHSEFVGWNLYDGQDWAMYKPDLTYNTGLVSGEETKVNIYAAWKLVDSYVIAYNGNGGSNVPASEYVFKNENCDIPETPVPIKPDYHFMEWNTQVDGSGDSYRRPVVKENQKNVIEKITGPMTLFAIWEKNPAVTYNANGGTFSSTPEKQYPLPGTPVDVELSRNLPTKTGYNFVGWSTTDVGETEIEFTKGGTTTDFVMPEKAVTLYAMWEAKDINVTFEASENNYYTFKKKTGENSYSAITSSETVKYNEDYSFRVVVPNYVDSESMAVFVNGALQPTPAATTNEGNTEKYYDYTLSKVHEDQNIVVQNCNPRQYNIIMHDADDAVIKVTSDDTTQTLSSTTMTYTYGTELTLPTDVTRTGYDFLGWYTVEQTKTPAEDTFKVTKIAATESEDKEIYAHWTAKQYSVILHTQFGDAYSGQNKTETLNFDYGEATKLTPINELSEFTYPGGGTTKFLGWSKTAGSMTPDYLDGSTVTNLVTYEQIPILDENGEPKKDSNENVLTETDDTINLYAVWSLPKKNIVLDANGGKYTIIKDDIPTYPVTQNFEFRKGEVASIPNCVTPTRTGYNFAGYAKESNADAAVYTMSGNTLTVPKAGENGIDEDYVLYAVWTPKSYTIKFYGNGGNFEGADTENEGSENAKKYHSEQYTYDETKTLWINQFVNQVTITEPDPAESDEPESEGENSGTDTGSTPTTKVFLGWATGEDDANNMKITYLDGQSILNLCTGEAGSTSKALYAVWGNTPIYYLGYDANGGSWSGLPVEVLPGTGTGEEEAPVKLATVKYPGDNASGGEEASYGELKRDGYEFVGWNTKEKLSDWDTAVNSYVDACVNGNDSVEKPKPEYYKGGEKVSVDVTSQNVTLYAAWTPVIVKNTITFYGNGGQLISATEGGGTGTGQGGTGEAGSGESGNGETGTGESGTGEAGTGGSGTGQGGTETEEPDVTYTQTIWQGKTAQLETPFKMDGYVLAGWSTESEGSIQYQAKQFVLNPPMTDNNLKLYAVWKEGPKVQLAYNANGGSNAPALKSYTKENDDTAVVVTLSFESSSIPVRDGYDFLGWAEVPNAATATYTSVEGHNTISLSNDTTLYAVWEKSKTYTIAYSSNSGTGSVPVDVRQYYNGDTVNVSFNQIPTRSGYTFAGWSMNQNKDASVEDTDSTAEKEYTYTEFGKNSFTLDIANMVTGDTLTVTLYAVWKPNTYSIVYTNSIDDKEVTQSKFKDAEGNEIPIQYGQTFNLKTYAKLVEENPDFAADSNIYDFKGWSTTENGAVVYPETTGESAKGAEVSNLVSTNDGSISLYAVFEPKEITINFMKDDQTLHKTSTAYYGQNLPDLDSSYIPVKEGYTFEGYFSEAVGGTQYYNKDLQAVRQVDFNEENKNLYAHWKAVSYYIYYQQGANQVAAQKVEFGSDITIYSENDLSNVEIPAGYRLAGYSNIQNGPVVYSMGDTVTLNGNDEVLWNAGKDRTLYVVTTKDVTYTVTYEANGGYNVPTDSKQYIENEDVTVKFDTIPKRTGYTFAGWATLSDAEGPNYVKLENGDVTFKIANDTKLYAVWTPNAYTITYDPNGGTAEENMVLTQDTNYAETPTLLGETGFSKQGYTLMGWATNKNGSVAYGLEETLSQPLATADGAQIELYAVWKANTYKVVYKKNNELVTGTMNKQTMTYDTETTLRNNTFQLTGSEFVGWNTEPDASEAEYGNAEGVINLTDEANGTINLYAIWSKKAITVSYISNSKVIDKKTVAYGEEMPVLTEAPVRTGYTFDGYYDAVEGGKKIYDADLSTTATVDGVDDIILYAHWIPLTYNINYKQGDTLLTTTQEAEFGSQITLRKEETLLESGLDIPTGYQLAGFARQPDGEVVADVGEKITVNEDSVLWNEGNDITLYAVVKNVAVYTVTYEGNGGYNIPTDRNEYAPGKTVTVKWDKIPKRTGYTFAGWATQEESQTADYVSGGTDTFTIDEDVTLYAVWTPNEYTITYNVNGGDGEAVTEKVAYEGEYYFNSTVTRKGYTLLGWATNRYGTAVYGPGEPLYQPLSDKSDANITLYAIWQQNDYQVVYNANKEDATGTMDSQDMTYDVRVKLYQNEFQAKGYTFAGWSATPDGEVKYTDTMTVSNLTDEANGTATLYAIWQPNTYEVAFDANVPENATSSVSGTMANQSFTYDKSQKLAKNAYSLKGYTFAGWADQAVIEDDTEIIQDEAEQINLITDGVKTLYAVWAKNHYSIVFDSNVPDDTENEVQGTMSEQAMTYDEEKALPKNGYSLKGYTFAGWATTADAVEAEYQDEQTVSNFITEGEQVLYAIWQPSTYQVEFDANHKAATGTMKPQLLTYGEESSLTKNAYKLEGYTFEGWSSTADGKVEYADAAKVTNLTEEADATVMLYAIWKKVSTPATDPGTTPGTDPGSNPGTTPGVDAGTTPGADVTAPAADAATQEAAKGDTAEEQAIIDTLKVSADTAKKILELAKQLNISVDVLMVTSESVQNQTSEDVKGATFGKLFARTTKLKNNAVTLKWTKAAQADGYMVFGNMCGTKNKFKLLQDVGAGTTSFTQKKLKKGTYYKYVVLAYKVVDGQKVTIAASKTIHATTLGKKFGVAKAVKVNKSKVSLKKGKTFKIKSKEVKQKNAIKRHRKVAYESSEEAVATVSSKGIVKGVAKGTCYIYVYAQNGVYKQIKVTVK